MAKASADSWALNSSVFVWSLKEMLKTMSVVQVSLVMVLKKLFSAEPVSDPARQ